jgi:hypothetical protein
VAYDFFSAFSALRHSLMNAFRSSPLSFLVLASITRGHLLLLGHGLGRLQTVAHEGLASVALQVLLGGLGVTGFHLLLLGGELLLVGSVGDRHDEGERDSDNPFFMDLSFLG